MDCANEKSVGPCLYVANLHPDVNEISLYEKFSEIGSVTVVHLCRNALTKQSLRCGYIKYKKSHDMENALIQLNFTYLNNMLIRLWWINKIPDLNGLNVGHIIFLKNLPNDIDNKELYNNFAQMGNIRACKIVLGKNNRSNGLGFVDFEDERSADKAIKKVNDGMRLRGVKVYGEKFIPQKKVRFHYVLIKNLPEDMDAKKLKAIFEEIGSIEMIKLSIYKGSTSHKFGFICLKNLKHPIEALQLLKNKIESQTTKCQGSEHETIELKYIRCDENGLYNERMMDADVVHKKKPSHIHKREEKKILKETNNRIEEKSSNMPFAEKGNEKQASNCIGENTFSNSPMKKNKNKHIFSSGSESNSIRETKSPAIDLKKEQKVSSDDRTASNSIQGATLVDIPLKKSNEDQKISSNDSNQNHGIIMTSSICDGKTGYPNTALEKIDLNDNRVHLPVVSKDVNNSTATINLLNTALMKNYEKISPTGIQMPTISTTKAQPKFHTNVPTVNSRYFQQIPQSTYNQVTLKNISPQIFLQPVTLPTLSRPNVMVFPQSPQYPIRPMFPNNLPQPQGISYTSQTNRPPPPTLRESIVKNRNLDYVKQIVGENIYPKVEFLYPKLAQEILGILLKQNSSILDMMENNEFLKLKVEEAVLLLRSDSKD